MPVEDVPQPSVNTPKETTASSDGFVRLHITPLDADLLKIVISASILPSARNISYHNIETFPEKRYGFVELPQADAEKLKNKLNGTVLRGSKMRIEKARPEERPEPSGEEEEVQVKKKRRNDEGLGRSKKRKRDTEVLEGVTIKDRKVKRGWTESPTEQKKKTKKDRTKDSKDKEKQKRKRLKSKYTEGEECLLKTKLPPSALGNLSAEELVAQKRKKKKGSAREVTVHEFEKTTKFPSFLKNMATTSDIKSATEFVEGKGWVDESGEVVEAIELRLPDSTSNRRKKVVKPKPVIEVEDDDSTSSSGTSSDDTSSDEDSDVEEAAQVQPKASKEQKDGDTESDTSSSESDEDVGTKDSKTKSQSKQTKHATPPPVTKESSPRPSSSSSSKNLSVNIPQPSTPSATKTEVHPLEALYKRPQSSGEALQTPGAKTEAFRFFGGGDVEDEETDQLSTMVPMTPFTRQDMEWRNVRSAAPTPDTAHPSRVHNFWSASEAIDEDMEEVGDVDMGGDADEGAEEEPSQGQLASSDFQKWFWENRRELNRSWMSRRKTAAKEKRHRENKARASKAV